VQYFWDPNERSSPFSGPPLHYSQTQKHKEEGGMAFVYLVRTQAFGQDDVSGLAIPPSLTETPLMPLPPWKKVLVVDLGFLGDTVHSIPAIRAIAQSGALVDVMTTPVGADLLGLVPEVNRCWIIPLRKPSPPPWRHLTTLLAIRAEKYDVALTFSGSDRNLFCTAFSGASKRIAAISRRRWWLPLLPLTRKVEPASPVAPLFEQRIAVLQKLGWTGRNPGWSWSQSRSMNPPPPPKAINLSVSAFGSSHKEWPLNLWAEAIRLVLKVRPTTNFIVGFANSSREKSRAQNLAECTGSSQLHVLNEAISLPELAFLLQKVDLFAGLDSGVLHLAMAMGKPTVSVFRDYQRSQEWVPRGNRHIVLKRLCECDLKKRNLCGQEARCLAAISPQEVAEAMLALLPPTQAIA
jgi:ADP-heptose:LPS heptosyltransferase